MFIVADFFMFVIVVVLLGTNILCGSAFSCICSSVYDEDKMFMSEV